MTSLGSLMWIVWFFSVPQEVFFCRPSDSFVLLEQKCAFGSCRTFREHKARQRNEKGVVIDRGRVCAAYSVVAGAVVLRTARAY